MQLRNPHIEHIKASIIQLDYQLGMLKDFYRVKKDIGNLKWSKQEKKKHLALLLLHLQVIKLQYTLYTAFPFPMGNNSAVQNVIFTAVKYMLEITFLSMPEWVEDFQILHKEGYDLLWKLKNHGYEEYNKEILTVMGWVTGTITMEDN